MSEHPGFDLKVFGPMGGWVWPFLPMAGAMSEPAAPLPPGDTPAQHFTAQLGQAFKACGRCQLELFGIATRRAQAYLQLGGQLAACRTPADVLEVQAEFWQRAVGQYMEASEHLAEIAGTMMPKAAAQIQERAAGDRDRDYIDFAAPARSSAAKPEREKAAREPQRRVA